MVLASSVLLKRSTVSGSWIWSQPTPQGRRDQKWDFCVCLEELISGIWMCQGHTAMSESRNKGQKGSALAVKTALYTRSVIPSSFHLFPVSSTAAGTMVGHAENCVFWAQNLCWNDKLPSCQPVKMSEEDTVQKTPSMDHFPALKSCPCYLVVL